MCQKMNSHDPVSMFAPSRPIGENAPANVSACGMTIRAVKRYPVASASSAREREIENCAYSRVAVIRSLTNTMASNDGKNALSSASGLPAIGTTAANPASTTAVTASARRVCTGVGGRSSHVSAVSLGSIAPPTKPRVPIPGNSQ